jgi:3-oxo-5alpha-steroid 4-dehydrogenase
VRRRLDRLHRLSLKPGLYAPALARRLHRRIASLESRWGRPFRVAARRGVVLAAGGFVNNREMMREHAPAYRGGLPLGTQGDDGSGIRLGTSAGGATDRLSTVSAWRFLTPPSALLRGILVDPSGARFVDESSYGAAVGARLIEGGGKAWLLVDEPIMADARRQVRTETLWFQRLQAWYLLRWSRVRGASLSEVARRAGIDPASLAATVAAYGETPDAFGKDPGLVAPLTTPPYTLIDCSYGPRLGYPCPMLTLGGLVVDESTGQVLSESGDPVAGLYAAGRTAVGICSNSYVSGLSLADCVFSGRRAGTHAATQSLDSHSPS